MEFELSAPKSRPDAKESIMKKDTVKKRRSIDFSKGIRGKYADMDLVIVGAAPKQKRIESKAAEAVLKKVSRVLNSAGPNKRDLEAAINRARDLIESARTL
ncbi:MAG TPA: hypothetical protein VK582_25190 [Pyrinomonadaceae bacterium]|nr:hypothetical protein [Pyrinomonadaceae bacterium]